MAMAVVDVRKVRMSMGQRLMIVRMGMRLFAIPGEGVHMLVMRVVRVRVLVA